MKTLELYFHIPFCVQKCLYCDFLSAPADEGTKRKYMEALLTETVGSAVQYQEYVVDSIFIGGGTPSTVAVEDMEHLLETVRGNYTVAEDVEITIEINPGTVDAEKLSRYRKAGINRLSIGMQSAKDEEMVRLGRIHTWQQFETAFRDARRVGFANINVDIMSALPGQSVESYEETLQKVLALENPPEHISAYSLIVEEGTPFGEMYEKNLLQLPDEETDRFMYHRTRELLQGAGYHRYEISNYAKPGYACKHNCGYWTRKNYVGFGIGAASLVENVRFRNGDDINIYMEEPCDHKEEIEVLTIQEQMEETLFLGLRLTEGVDAGEFAETFGKTLEEIYGEVIARNMRAGLLQWQEKKLLGQEDVRVEQQSGAGTMLRHRLALTEMGLDVSNYVMAQFLL